MLKTQKSFFNELNRRSFLGSSGLGIGSTALNGMLARDAACKDSGLSGLPDLPVKAKRVIFWYE